MADLTNRDFRRFWALVENRIGLVKTAVAFDVLGRLVLKNPVDTGYSRANWNVAIGQPDLSTLPPPRRLKVTRRGPNGRVRTHASVRQRTPPRLRDVKTGEDVWVTNNVVYMGRLAKGHSKQAEAGWMMQAVNETAAQYEAIVRSVVPIP